MSYANSEGPDQTAHAQSDQGLHCSPIHYLILQNEHEQTTKDITPSFICDFAIRKFRKVLLLV